MTSVERIKEYGNLPSEAAQYTNYPLPLHWPTEGAIAFHNTNLTYFKGNHKSLNNVTFSVASNEKVVKE